jgi:hypothetical protein
MNDRSTVDRSDWPSGPWDDEPDQLQWVDANTGRRCLIRRNFRSGILLGYVGVELGDPAYGLDYADLDVDVHGGLTWSGHNDRWSPGTWWLGFDCGHACDQSPHPDWTYGEGEEVRYRTIGYVRRHCELLAAQLSAKFPTSKSH